MSGTFMTGVATGTDYFALFFGAQPDGDQSVRVLGNGAFTPEYILNGAGSGYHNYQLEYSAAYRTADLWVDGMEIYSDLQGQPGASSAHLLWGGQNAFSSLGTIEARWESITLSIIPEPGPTSLTSCAQARDGVLGDLRC
jgi:hypothetical protein